MTHRTLAFAAVLVAAAAPALQAQTVSADATAATLALSFQEARVRKSPALAGVLSWFVFPGVGSYYAGNGRHGTRHVLIALPTFAAGIALLATCDSDGFCDFDHDGARLSVAIALGVGYTANAIWSVLTAISDAEQYNLRTTTGGVSFAPAVFAMEPSGGAQRMSSVGLRLVRVAF